MAATHRLFDVDPFALTICKKGANRQTIFLRKSQATDGDTFTLPHREGLIHKSGEWSVFYCVVAEPGAEEDGGIGADGVVDMWKSEEEIRKAAHRFAKNAGYINAMHGAMEEAGCTVVENAVAHADFVVGEHVIKKGSWYVAIEPSPAFRELVDAGEITGVSLEGTGLREALTKESLKVPIPNKPGKSNWVERSGGFPPYIRDVIEHILGSRPELLADSKGVSKAIQLGIGIVENWAEGHDGKGHKVSAETATKAQAAVATYRAQAASSKIKKGSPMGNLLDKLRKTHDMDTLTPEEELILKATNMRTFDGIVAARELEEELPDAMGALQDVIWQAFYSDAADSASVRGVLSTSADQFKAWLLATYDEAMTSTTDNSSGDSAGSAADTVMKALGIDPASRSESGSVGPNNTEETMDKDTQEAIAAIQKSAEDNNTAIATLSGLVGDLVKHVTSKKDEETVEVKKSESDVATALSGVMSAIQKVQADVDAILDMEVGSTQPEPVVATPVKKSTNPLAGLLS